MKLIAAFRSFLKWFQSREFVFLTLPAGMVGYLFVLSILAYTQGTKWEKILLANANWYLALCFAGWVVFAFVSELVQRRVRRKDILHVALWESVTVALATLGALHFVITAIWTQNGFTISLYISGLWLELELAGVLMWKLHDMKGDDREA